MNRDLHKTSHDLGIVAPCFNEEAVLPETNSRLVSLLQQMKDSGIISVQSSIFYVDDGKKDRTWALIEDLSNKFTEVCGIKLSRNRGHQNTLLCGLDLGPLFGAW